VHRTWSIKPAFRGPAKAGRYVHRKQPVVSASSQAVSGLAARRARPPQNALIRQAHSVSDRLAMFLNRVAPVARIVRT
jgi:hypothetical protein